MLMTTNIYQNGKVFKNIDYQIMMRKGKIKVLEQSINKSFKLAGINGPSGTNGLGIDYSRVTSSTPAAHIGLDDAIRLSDQDKNQILILENEIIQLRNMKKNLLRTLKNLDGIEEQIFYRRVILSEKQEEAAENIGVSTRHLQRIEKQMKESFIIFEM